MGNAVPHVGSVAFQKAGADQVALRADPSERVTGQLAVRLALQAVENRVHLSEPVLRVSVSLYTNPRAPGPRRSTGVEITRTSEPNGRNQRQSARLDTNFRPQNHGAVGYDVARDHDDGRVFDFSMGSTFRAIGQSPARNALVSEI